MFIRVYPWLKILAVAAWCIGAASAALAQSTLPTHAPNFGGARIEPNRADNIARPLRYRPDGTDFVTVNGAGNFNRPLYAARTSFRVDAGDRPEFAVNLPRKGGVLRLGLAGEEGRALWLHEAAQIEMRYRPGSVIYAVRDPRLGDATLTLSVQALRERTAAIWKIETDAVLPGDVVWSFAGGHNRSANERNGDIIAGRDPAEIMPPTQAETAGNRIAADMVRYLNRAGAFDFITTPSGPTGAVEFESWNSAPDPTAWLPSTAAPSAPVLQGQLSVSLGEPTFLGLFATTPESSFSDADLAALWDETEAARAALVGRVVVDTPDPFLNALPGALLVAADAVWQEPHVMHGAIAWRMPLLGWRGPAALDTLGWHERFRAYARHWIAQQNTDAADFPDPPAADPAKNLATDDWRALHGFGSIPARHYDMALGFVDLLLRHLMWTGDLDFAREVWPFLERHLDWEKRCFDRDGLYESYAAIWASDALTYNGGGTTHASALNYWHRVMAAEIARRLGEDPAPHTAEAERIHAAMTSRLWNADMHFFGEYVERAGLQRRHDATALWTFYHVLDSEVLGRFDAQRFAQWMNLIQPRIPVTGPGVPEGEAWMLPTTIWQPYEWSLNNVVPSENAHAALAFWQAGRPDLAWPLWRGTLLDAMYLSQSPGNIPNLSQLDVHRRETYRDFADPIGTFSRALVEGLFGVRPDAIRGVLTLAPGFPLEWEKAAITTPDFAWRFRRHGRKEYWTWTGTLPGIETLRLRVPARGLFQGAWVDDRQVAEVRVQSDARGGQWIELEVPAKNKLGFSIQWDGDPPHAYDSLFNGDPVASPHVALPEDAAFDWETIPLGDLFNDQVDAIFTHEYLSPRSPHVSLSLPKQGLGSWSDFRAQAELDDSGLRDAATTGQGKIAVPDGVEFATPVEAESANVAFVSWWENFPRELSTPLHGRARHLAVLVAGSTGPMHSWIDNGEIEVTYTDGTSVRLPLTNPRTWWPIERDYVIDDFAFRHVMSPPWRLELGTGQWYRPDGYGGRPTGGAATALSLQLDPTKELKSLTVRALSTEVVVGLLAASLAR